MNKFIITVFFFLAFYSVAFAQAVFNDKADTTSILDLLYYKYSHHEDIYSISLVKEGLTKLPDDVVKCKNVEVVDLSLNPNLDLVATFKLLAKCPKLRSLTLEGNKLKELPDEIGLLVNLDHISLGANSIECLPLGFGRLKKMESLRLPYNPTIDIECVVNHIVQYNKKIRRVDFRHNNIQAFPKDLSKLSQLTHIIISSNKINTLPCDLAQNKSLEWLSIRNNANFTIPECLDKYNSFTIFY